MSQQIRFIHCADLHIDSPFKGIGELPPKLERQVRESSFASLQSLVDQAIANEVDFIVIAGDLFDHEVRSLKAQIRLRNAFRELEEHGIQVYASHGNHDFLSASFHPVEYPANVHVFKEPHVTHQYFYKNGEPQAVIYGFSYYERAVTEKKAEEYMRVTEGKYHIAMLHGSIETNTEHDVYAPFRLSDLQSREMDYWALGHIHKREILTESPPIVYPGNIQGRSINESGEKGCYLVEMDEIETELTFLPLHSFQFQTIDMRTEAGSLEELERVIIEEKNQWRQTGPAIVHLHLIGGEELAELWQYREDILELQEIINEQEQAEDRWIWIRTMALDAVPSWNEEELKQEKHFVGEVLRQFETFDDVEELLKPLFRHRVARKHLEQLTEEEKESVLKEAKDLVLTELMK